MYPEVSENLTQGYFASQKVLVALGQLRKKYQNLVEIIAVLNLKIRCY